MRRVVVTGMGAVSPLGNTLHESWEAAINGVSGIGNITRFDSGGLKWKAAGELKGFEAGKYLTKKELLRLDPFIHYAVAASVMAAGDAGLIKGNNEKKDNLKSGEYVYYEGMKIGGVITGSSRGGISSLEQAVIRCAKPERRKRAVSPYLMPATTISMASSYTALKLGIKGYCLGISNACASGTCAIGEGYRLIKSGYENPLLCGGTEAPLCRTCFEGYGTAGALSETEGRTASRPFDRTRDGFVLSEGACMLVLEEYENALRRGARIYGEIAGYGNTSDAFHQTTPSFEGEARAINEALDDAGIEPCDVGFINAHGTSTLLGDAAESGAVIKALGTYASEAPVTSLKSMTGHMLAASGALEAAFTLMSLRQDIITPTVNLIEKDTECTLDIVTETRECNVKLALSNSFGFGGINAVLVFRRLDS